MAEIAVTLVLDCGGVYDADPWRWQDVASDALAVVAGGLNDERPSTRQRVCSCPRGATG
jgi:hypothetical protein